MTPYQQQWDSSNGFDDVRKFIGKVLRKWYLVAGILVVIMAGAFYLNRYSPRVYVINASFITKKFDQNRMGQLAGVIEEDMFMQTMEVNQEIPFLKSQDKIEETLRRLDFGVSYFIEGRFKTTEIYGSYPYRLQYDSASTFIPYGVRIDIISENKENFVLIAADDKIQPFFSGQLFHFGQTYTVNGWTFKLSKLQQIERGVNSYFFEVNHPAGLLSEYRQKLGISWAQKGSAILNVNVHTELPEKDLAFVKTYLDVVTEKGLRDKNEHLTNTINFINSYIVDISDTLLKYQERIDNYKLANREIMNGSSYVFEKLSALDQQKMEIMLSDKYYDYLTNYISHNRTSEVFAPNLIGLNEPLLNDLVNQYVASKLEDKAAINAANEKNPLINRESAQYQRIEKNIFESLRGLKQANQEKLRDINEKSAFYYNAIKDFQVESRDYSELQRMQAIYNNLFNDLIARRTSAHIAKASTTSDYQMVTSPGYSSVPIKPDRNKNLLIAFFLGLGLPVGLIYMMDLFNAKIISKDDLLKNTSIPLIGNIGHSGAATNLVVRERPKSSVSESFRGVRANLQYMKKGESGCQVYLVTSSIAGEGKTFCSINLADTFALAGKKTVIIGADMRKPTLAKNFDLADYKGLSNYLAGFVPLEEIIYEFNKPKLSLVPGGDVPPNPAELLAAPRMTELIEYARENYEAIIIDTPPIGLVSDAMELIRFSDANLLVVRQGKSYKDSLIAITEMYSDGKISNLGILFNDIDHKKYDYGYHYSYGYGYGYGNGNGSAYGYYDDEETKKGFLTRIFKP